VLLYEFVRFFPLIAASILVYREHKTAGVTELLKRSFDYKRIRAKVWYVPTVLLMPGIAVLAYGLMRLIRLPLPVLQFLGVAALVMFLVFFIAGLITVFAAVIVTVIWGPRTLTRNRNV
jgi:hypothetical protein